MKEPVWILENAVLAIHERQIAEFGGSSGVRDAGLLESALNRPQNAFAYKNVDIFGLAAAYAFGLAKNHPFVDGNKRVALVVSRIFLLRNGYDIRASQQEKYETFYGLAAGTLSETELAKWTRQNEK
jgi:death-on-curing protein